MAKILNLDALSANEEARELVIKGVTYPVIEMSVANFIETTRAAEKLSDAASIVDQIEATIDMIIRCVPTLPREALGGLTLEKLRSITAFVRGDNEQADTVPADKAEDGTPAGN